MQHLVFGYNDRLGHIEIETICQSVSFSSIYDNITCGIDRVIYSKKEYFLYFFFMPVKFLIKTFDLNLPSIKYAVWKKNEWSFLFLPYE